MSRHVVALLASSALLLVSISLSALRLRQGVDFMDESLSIAIPYRFALGDQPYIDEVNSIQSASLIVEPLVRLRLALAEGTEGIVLFLRVAWFVLMCALGGLAYWSLRPLVPRSLARIAAAAVVAWFPLGSPVLSYNTLASVFFTASLLLGSAPFLSSRSETWLLAAGAALGLCVVSIQAWAVPCAFTCACWIVASPKPTRRWRATFLLGGACVTILPFVPSYWNFGADALEFAREHARRLFPITSKLEAIARTAWLALEHPALALACAAATLVCAWRGSRLAATALFLVLVQLVVPFREHRSSLLFVTFLASLAPLAWPMAGEREKKLLALVWLPSFVAGVTTTFASTNGLVNAGFGLLPAALVTLVVWFPVGSVSLSARASQTLAALAFVSVPAWMLVHQRTPFNDDAVPRLDARFESGPFRGLSTSQRKKAWFEALSCDLAEQAREHRRLLVYYRLPAAYLLTSMRPAANTVYVPRSFGIDERDAVEPYRRALERTDGDEIVVVRMRRLVFGLDREQDVSTGRVDEFIQSRCTLLRSRSDWDVLVARTR